MQPQEIDNLCEVIFKAGKCVITALLYRLSAGGEIVHGLAVIKHFVAGLLKQLDKIRRLQWVNLHDFEIVNMA